MSYYTPTAEDWQEYALWAEEVDAEIMAKELVLLEAMDWEEVREGELSTPQVSEWEQFLWQEEQGEAG